MENGADDGGGREGGGRALDEGRHVMEKKGNEGEEDVGSLSGLFNRHRNPGRQASHVT